MAPALPLDERMLRRLESLMLRSHVLAHGVAPGARASRAPGAGVAFASHRAYSPGDDVRFVDWKVYARSERLVLRQHEEERDRDVHLLLDCSASMGVGQGARKLRFATEVAALLGYVALARLDRLSVHGYATTPSATLGPLRGRGQALLLLRHLATLAPAGLTSLDAAARAVCARASRGGLAVVLSDTLDDTFLRGIDRLRYGGLAPVLLHLVDPSELSLPAGELTLVDSESGATVTVRATDALRTRAARAREVRDQALHAALGERGVPQVALSVELSLERALGLLVARGVVG